MKRKDLEKIFGAGCCNEEELNPLRIAEHEFSIQPAHDQEFAKAALDLVVAKQLRFSVTDDSLSEFAKVFM